MTAMLRIAGYRLIGFNMWILLILSSILIGGYFLMNSKTGQDIITSATESAGTAAQTVSDFIVSYIAGFEGYSPTPYKDVDKIAWGYGHNQLPGETVPPYISEPDARELLIQDTKKSADIVDRYVTVSLTENQRNALISFVFNTASNDETRFSSSHLLSKLNAGDYQGAADEMEKWIHAGSSVSNVLIARREQERDLFLT